MDDWQFVPLIERVRGGEIPWRELAAPHDEHRLLIPRILIIASAILSHGNYRAQCFITFGVVLALSLALLFLLRRSLGTGRLTPVVWLLVNLILFSPIQWHNWLWPMQFCYFLPFTLLGLCLAAFYSDLSAGARFALCQLCAWAASFSFIHGLLIWPVMLPALLRDARWGSPRARRLAAALWIGAALLVGTLYLDGLFANTADPAYAYQHKGEPPTASTLRMLGDQPLDTLGRISSFAFAMLGNAVVRGLPVSSNLVLSIRAGFLLLVGGHRPVRRPLPAGRARRAPLRLRGAARPRVRDRRPRRPRSRLDRAGPAPDAALHHLRHVLPASRRGAGLPLVRERVAGRPRARLPRLRRPARRDRRQLGRTGST